MKSSWSKGHGSHTDNLNLKFQSSQEFTEKPLKFWTASGTLAPTCSVYNIKESCLQELATKLYIYIYIPINLDSNCHRIIMACLFILPNIFVWVPFIGKLNPRTIPWREMQFLASPLFRRRYWWCWVDNRWSNGILHRNIKKKKILKFVGNCKRTQIAKATLR